MEDKLIDELAFSLPLPLLPTARPCTGCGSRKPALKGTCEMQLAGVNCPTLQSTGWGAEIGWPRGPEPACMDIFPMHFLYLLGSFSKEVLELTGRSMELFTVQILQESVRAMIKLITLLGLDINVFIVERFFTRLVHNGVKIPTLVQFYHCQK